MKNTLENGTSNATSPILEVLGEEWTPEMLRKRSEELRLIDSHGNIIGCFHQKRTNDSSSCDEIPIDQPSDINESPSKSTTTESQITVRSSPLVPETVPVCRQCHKNCLSNVLSNTSPHSKLTKLPIVSTHYNCHKALVNGNIGKVNGDCVREDHTGINDNPMEDEKENWRSFLLAGFCANPVANLVKFDPFQRVPQSPKIVPPTPESCTENGLEQNHVLEKSCSVQTTSDTPDDSPQTEDHPYHSLSSSVLTLRRYGTVSSLERLGSSEEKEELEKNELENDKEVPLVATENHIDYETDSLEDSEKPNEVETEDEEELGIDNEAFNHSSILSWTAKAGSYVAEKMAIFEKLSEDYRSGGGFFERYLKSNENTYLNGTEDVQEEETSGGTSGEEIWGTPTSGGDLDDPPNSPNLEDKLSPNHDSLSDTMDDTEFIMDELLMTPPISGAVLRGLLPRRTLEPLIEEDFTESSSDEEDSSERSCSSKSKGSQTGNAADRCLPNAANINHRSLLKNIENLRDHPSPTNQNSKSTKTNEFYRTESNLQKLSSTSTNLNTILAKNQRFDLTYPEQSRCATILPDCSAETAEHLRNGAMRTSDSWEMVKTPLEMEMTNQPVSSSTTESMATAVSSQSMNEDKLGEADLEEGKEEMTLNMPRSESYRKILELTEEPEIDSQEPGVSTIMVEPIFFKNFRQTASFVSIQKVPKSRSSKIFEFFNVRRIERRIYEQFPENRPLLNDFSKENSMSDSVPTSYAEKPISASKVLKDKQMDRRFWKQLSKRRSSAKKGSS